MPAVGRQSYWASRAKLTGSLKVKRSVKVIGPQLTPGDPKSPGVFFNDRSTVIYNSRITLRGIPLEAWDYVVNGKAALSWVMERQAVIVHKVSDIINDANDWAIETMGNPKYPLELFQRMVTVNLETQKIVNSLPPLDI